MPSFNQTGPSPGRTPAATRNSLSEESDAVGTIVVKIGGSTLGSHDTTLRDLAELQRRGMQAVVVHGGGKVISDWMAKQGVKPSFVRGLRVTDDRSLEIVVATLAGLINKSLAASMAGLGARAIGMSGADGGMLRAEVRDAALGHVGSIVSVNTEPIDLALGAGYIPIVAPVAMRASVGTGGADSVDVADGDGTAAAPALLNINADTAAGEIARALSADRLVFLTDVQGVLDTSNRLIPRLTGRQARGLISSNVAAGGMIPKLEACLTALDGGGSSHIIDGRRPSALMEIVCGAALGTRVG